MKVPYTSKQTRLQEGWSIALQIAGKYGVDLDLVRYLIAPMASINPYYFDTPDNVLLHETVYMENLTEQAKNMQYGALRRLKKESPDFFERVRRWLNYKNTGYFEALPENTETKTTKPKQKPYGTTIQIPVHSGQVGSPESHTGS